MKVYYLSTTYAGMLRTLKVKEFKKDNKANWDNYLVFDSKEEAEKAYKQLMQIISNTHNTI